MQPTQQLLWKLFGNSSVNTHDVASDVEEKDIVINAQAIADYVEQNGTALIGSDFEALAKQAGKNSNQEEVINGCITKLRNSQSISIKSRDELIKGAKFAKKQIQLNEKLTEISKNANMTNDITKTNIAMNATTLKVVGLVAFFFCVTYAGYAYLAIQGIYDQDFRHGN